MQLLKKYFLLLFFIGIYGSDPQQFINDTTKKHIENLEGCLTLLSSNPNLELDQFQRDQLKGMLSKPSPTTPTEQKLGATVAERNAADKKLMTKVIIDNGQRIK